MSSTSLAITTIVVGHVGAVANSLGSRSNAFLGLLEHSHSDMRPDRVAHTLIGVEDNWRSQAMSFASCSSEAAKDGTGADSCSGSMTSFKTSCSKVASAVVHSSSGDRADVVDYMQDVCGQAELQGWHQARCNEFASGLAGALTEDEYLNRESFDPNTFCSSLWQRVLAEEISEMKTREHQEAQQRAEEAKQLADEAEAQYALKKQAHLDAKIEVARHSNAVNTSTAATNHSVTPVNITVTAVPTPPVAATNTSVTPVNITVAANTSTTQVNATNVNVSGTAK